MASTGPVKNIEIVIAEGDGSLSEVIELDGYALPAFFFPAGWENDAKLVPLAGATRDGPFCPMGDDLGAAIELVMPSGTSSNGEGYAMRCEERLFQHVRYIRFRASAAQSAPRTVIAQAVPVDSLVAAQQ